MTANDLDPAVHSCPSKRFCIGIRLTIVYKSKFNSSAKNTSKTNRFLRSRPYPMSPTCNEGWLTCLDYFLFYVNFLLVLIIKFRYNGAHWLKERAKAFTSSAKFYHFRRFPGLLSSFFSIIESEPASSNRWTKQRFVNMPGAVIYVIVT